MTPQEKARRAQKEYEQVVAQYGRNSRQAKAAKKRANVAKRNAHLKSLLETMTSE